MLSVAVSITKTPSSSVPHYSGGSCEYKTCPSGYGWFDEATSTDTAHATGIECSNMGVCNRRLGTCDCDWTYGNFGGKPSQSPSYLSATHIIRLGCLFRLVDVLLSIIIIMLILMY